jgi:glyoxylase-like metal-dependent hydrolase (beta-lactamase superfamily II)
VTVAGPGPLLRALGVTPLVMPIPLTTVGVSVNAYLIEDADGSLTLFDAGLGTREGQEILAAACAASGHRVEEIQRIIISHGHLDHYAGAGAVRERSHARVFVHPRDADKLAGASRSLGQALLMAEYLRHLGVPLQLIKLIGERHRSNRAAAKRIDATEPITGGTRLEFRHFTAEVVHTPGHTPGQLCLWAAGPRLAFTSDHLLESVTPSPVLELGAQGEPDRFRALPAYLESARALAALEPAWILPGHGPPSAEVRAIYDRIGRYYEERQRGLVAALTAGPRTPYELALALGPAVGPIACFLAVSDVIGNLELLEERGAVRRVPDAVPYRYARA